MILFFVSFAFFLLSLPSAQASRDQLACVSSRTVHWCDKPNARADAAEVFGTSTDLMKLTVTTQPTESEGTYVYATGFTVAPYDKDTDTNRPRTCDTQKVVAEVRQMFKRRSSDDRCGDGAFARNVEYIVSGMCLQSEGKWTFYSDPCGIRYRLDQGQDVVVAPFSGTRKHGGETIAGTTQRIPRVVAVKPQIRRAPRVVNGMHRQVQPQQPQPQPQAPNAIRAAIDSAIQDAAGHRNSAPLRILNALLQKMETTGQGYKTQGIFRLSASATELKNFLTMLNKSPNLNFLNTYNGDVILYAAAFKQILREMVDKPLASVYASAKPCIKDMDTCTPVIAQAIRDLDIGNKAILSIVAEAWRKAVAQKDSSFMGASNLAILFPGLLGEVTQQEALTAIPDQIAIMEQIITLDTQ